MTALRSETLPKVSMKEMCEVISEHWKTVHGENVAPETIFNYSRTGELSMIWEWYAEALEHKEGTA